MNSPVIILLATALLIIVIGFTWVMLRRYSQRLSCIDEELRAITVMLNEIPKETSLKEYMFAQDQKLHAIGEQLNGHPDTDLLQQYMQDQTTQMLAVISTLDESRKSGVTKTDLDISLRVINELLERVLWSLRFDEAKYLDRTEANKGTPNNQDNKNISKLNAHSEIRKDTNDKVSINDILDNCDDDYDAMIKYMQQSGKSGVEAQQALKSAKIMRGIS